MRSSAVAAAEVEVPELEVWRPERVFKTSTTRSTTWSKLQEQHGWLRGELQTREWLSWTRIRIVSDCRSFYKVLLWITFKSIINKVKLKILEPTRRCSSSTRPWQIRPSKTWSNFWLKPSPSVHRSPQPTTRSTWSCLTERVLGNAF